MTTQLSLPGIRRNRDPEVELERIERYKDDLRHDIRVVLDRYAEAREVSARAVNELMFGYVSDPISALSSRCRAWVSTNAPTAI